jgi:chemotaxis protein CheZ
MRKIHLPGGVAVSQYGVRQDGKRLFSAERKMIEARDKERRSGREATLEGLADTMQEMRDGFAAMRTQFDWLRGEIASLKSAHRDIHEAVAAQKAEEPTPEREQVSVLKAEIRGLAVCIDKTKSEIAAIRPSGGEDDRIVVVSNELDAIVASTETATNTILDSVEAIDGMVQEINAQVADTYVKGLVGDMQDKVTTILEACNFQDITGQRITKVVATLKYIEERINAMIEVWGDVGDADPLPAGEGGAADDHLLNGPQLEGSGVSQDDIDKMFG